MVNLKIDPFVLEITEISNELQRNIWKIPNWLKFISTRIQIGRKKQRERDKITWSIKFHKHKYLKYIKKSSNKEL